MARDLGFEPVTEGERYFISYNNNDSERIKRIVRRLAEAGLRMYYDRALIKGDDWETEISDNICGKNTKGMLLFITKNTFSSAKSGQMKEYKLATKYKESDPFVIPIWLDPIDTIDKTNDVHRNWRMKYAEIIDLHGYEASNKSDMLLAEEIIKDLVLSPSSDNSIYGVGQPKGDTSINGVGQPKGDEKNFDKIGENSNKPKSDSVKGNDPNILMTIIIMIAIIISVVALALSISKGQSNPVPYPSPQVEYLEINKNLQKGDRYVIFGSYPQGDNGEIEPLAWRVLDIKDGNAFLITENLIDSIVYSEERIGVSWEYSSLRRWLNKDFYEKAFSEDEQALIVEITNQNVDNPTYKTGGGNVTNDKIFLLSIDEANNYFTNDEDRMAAVTPYAYKQGAFANDDYKLADGGFSGWFWLRSPGFNGNCAATVGRNGIIFNQGSFVYTSAGTVRPAIWIRL